MKLLNFNLQIEMFRTINDNWENQEVFWCAFNEGYFRDDQSESCIKWSNDWWHIGKVKVNRWNSHDVIETSNKVFRTEEEACAYLETINQTA